MKPVVMCTLSAALIAAAGCSTSSGGGGGVWDPGGASGAGGDDLGSGGGTATGGTASGGAGAVDAGPQKPHQFSIVFDYRFDTKGFFDAKVHPERRASLEAAAALWTRVIHDDFSTVPAGTSLQLLNPEDRTQYVSVAAIEHDIDDLIVFVGTSAAIAPAYGRSSPAGTATTTDPSLAQELGARILGAPFQPWAGSVSFNPTANWYFDPTPDTADDIPQQQYDFQSFAVHELGHVLGFTLESPAYTTFLSSAPADGGVSWAFTGPDAERANGGAAVPFQPDKVHLVRGTVSGGEKALMNLSITNGTREVPTRLDMSVLEDLGYAITP